MDVRIGITQTPKELEVEMHDDADRDKVVADIEKLLKTGDGVLWLTDKKGRRWASRWPRWPTSRWARRRRTPRRVRRSLMPGSGGASAWAVSPGAPDLLQLKLVFVTGKGGVGKTTVAAGLAQLAAEHGKQVLTCEVDAKGDLSSLFEASPTEFVPREIAPGIWSCPWTPRRRCASTSNSICASRWWAASDRWPRPSTSWPRRRPGCARSSRWASSVTRCGSGTTTWSWWTRRPAATSSASWRRPRPSTIWSRWA